MQLVDSWFAEPEVEKPEWSAGSLVAIHVILGRCRSSAANGRTGHREFEVGAWLSAETSAWDAVRWAAESVDLAARDKGQSDTPTSLRDLQVARDAIREARDFSGVYGPLIARPLTAWRCRIRPTFG